jgi:signal transduction histidine kinase
MAFPPALIEKLLQTAISVPHLRAVVTDRQGLVVASNSAAGLRLGDKAVNVTSPERSTKGFYETTSPDGTRLQGAYAVSSTNGFIVRVALPVSEVGGPMSVLPKRWILLALSSLIACVAVVLMLGRRLTRPLKALAQAARQGLPAEGRASGIAEIDLLAQALRSWAVVEQKRRDELVISTRRQQAEVELRKVDRQKDDFLATLAHELRNPLAPIRTAAELIRLRCTSDTVVMRARDIIERQVVHLSRLVDDLLEVSRMTLGTIQLKQQALDLVALALHAAESVRPTVEAAGIKFVIDFADPAVVVVGDSTRLEQCVMNLLSNAAKFTPRGGNITFRVFIEGPLANIEVSDTGLGISKDNLERIFDLFMQESSSGSGGQTGLGIGLALTRRLVEAHGGTVRARSAGRGRGSTFRIELAASSMSCAANLAEVPSQLIGVAGARVLVVDDNCDAADLLGEAL